MSAEPDQTTVAFHEAGHAVMALALGRPVHKVSIHPNDMRLGHCELKPGAFRPTQDVVEMQVLILLGGLVAEARYSGRYAWDGAAQDLRFVRTLTSSRAGGPRQIERLERRMLQKAEHLLDQPENWRAVQRIAEELLKVTTISGRAARHLYDEVLALSE